jgi:hypothetical protein
MSNLPNDEQAIQFAIMTEAGLPPENAMLYFTDSDDPAEIMMMVGKWRRSKAYQKAVVRLMGKSWQDMSLDEKIKAGLDFQYASLAYLCKTINYATANQAEKAKLDSARTALEAKLAGVAGKSDPLSQFFDDLNSGKIKLNRPVQVASLGI